MNAPVDQDERIRSLEAFANARNEHDSSRAVAAPSVASLSAERVVGAQPVAVYRDEVKILQKLSALGAAAGDGWIYRFPVRNKRKGTTDYIEGPTIKLANDLARTYGNCEVQTRVIDLGNSWLIYARFNDFETGFALERPFQQQKGGSKMGGDDDARRLDIALQIGVSKAIRNVVVNALQTFADHAFDAARNSLVEKIGKNLVGWRDRTVQGIGNLGVDLVRVELVMGKSAKDWTAPDVAKVIAMMKAIADGMTTVDDAFPPREDARTTDAKVDVDTGEVTETAAKTETQAATTAEPESTKAAETVTESRGAGAKEESASSASAAVPTNDAEYAAYADAWIDAETSHEEVNARWIREKKLRSACHITQDTFDRLEAKKKAKVAALKGAK